MQTSDEIAEDPAKLIDLLIAWLRLIISHLQSMLLHTELHVDEKYKHNVNP
jgi:hypothetical protein